MNLLGAFASALLVAAVYQSEDPLLREVGRWSLAKAEHSCSIQAVYEDGTTLRVIASDVDSDWSFIFLNPRWTSVASGASVDIEVQFPGYASWAIRAAGLDPVEAGHAVGFQQDAREGFVAQFALAERLDLMREGLPVASLSMTDSRRAVQELISCQVELRNRPNFDPFQTNSQIDPGDPA